VQIGCYLETGPDGLHQEVWLSVTTLKPGTRVLSVEPLVKGKQQKVISNFAYGATLSQVEMCIAFSRKENLREMENASDPFESQCIQPKRI
jgi:hypothetical protein